MNFINYFNQVFDHYGYGHAPQPTIDSVGVAGELLGKINAESDAVLLQFFGEVLREGSDNLAESAVRLLSGKIVAQVFDDALAAKIVAVLKRGHVVTVDEIPSVSEVMKTMRFFKQEGSAPVVTDSAGADLEEKSHSLSSSHSDRQISPEFLENLTASLNHQNAFVRKGAALNLTQLITQHAVGHEVLNEQLLETLMKNIAGNNELYEASMVKLFSAIFTAVGGEAVHRPHGGLENR